jgi:hypothetical protein
METRDAAGMIESPENQDQPLPAEAAEPDPYDGVALGVECAWPIELTQS